LTYEYLKPYGPFSLAEIAFALERDLISEDDTAQILEDQLEAESFPFEIWQLVEKLRASHQKERSAIVRDLMGLAPDAGDPARRWILLLARDALNRYERDADVIAVLDQIWDDYGRPADFGAYTAIGNVRSTRPILDENDLRLIATSFPDRVASRTLLAGLRRHLDQQLGP